MGTRRHWHDKERGLHRSSATLTQPFQHLHLELPGGRKDASTVHTTQSVTPITLTRQRASFLGEPNLRTGVSCHSTERLE